MLVFIKKHKARKPRILLIRLLMNWQLFSTLSYLVCTLFASVSTKQPNNCCILKWTAQFVLSIRCTNYIAVYMVNRQSSTRL